MIRTLGWQTLFNSLVVYEQRFRQCLQTAGAFLPPFQEGDARALEAYLKVLMRVMEMGNEMERSQWFPDIGPLFKLLSYENVPPYLKGALRNAIATFVPISPAMKDKVWSLLEQYDLPVVATPLLSNGSMQPLPSQVRLSD
jgi:nuclear pore complex protein Nup205